MSVLRSIVLFVLAALAEIGGAWTPLDPPRGEVDLVAELDRVERALGLWRGEALEDVADLQFARGEITRLDELRWAAAERRTDLLLRLGRHHDVIGEVSRLLQQSPLRERLHGQLVLQATTRPIR